ncbi:MAG: tryptophan synthase alpha chain, partial [Pseudonocardiales bacterium]|nr:tryptophan synthase alpha chain [Pseudonocardiales bacterium]
RIVSTARASRGFVYAASTMGVTGTRTAVSGAAESLVARVRALAPDVPVCVGLGVSDGGQAAEVAAFADGVIVGSAFVRRLLDAPGASGVAAVRDLAADLAAGVRRR